MNPDLNKLQPYPFEKLNKLFAGIEPSPSLSPISLSIGEPKHPAPEFVVQELEQQLGCLSNYPATKGLPALREAIATWAGKRFNLAPKSLSAEQHVLPVNGTREALFSFTQATISRDDNALVLIPNPFYQIYEGAALLAGAQTYYLACDEHTDFLPNLDQVPVEIWQRCQLFFICSPGNPTGKVASGEYLEKLIQLADQYDFTIASDECYSELYFDESNPPTGLLEVCNTIGRTDFRRCMVFHSLSKRSNLPGLRSGFVAGDSSLIADFLLYRTYHGCAMPLQHQYASIKAWQDEQHVEQNRSLYRQKFEAVLNILADCLDVDWPDASFYLWAKTPIDDRQFAQQLYRDKNVTVLPGQFLARETGNGNPGERRIRIALVAELEQCMEAAERLRDFVTL
jgi:N-succinyldiaminopimelate aminotransferase